MAASTLLHPIVIPPISELPFHCAGNGLLYKGHARTSPPELRSLLLSRKRKNAKDPASSKTKAWWQAQLRLYGLPIPKSSAKLAELRERLVSAVQQGLCDSVPPHIREVEDRLNARFLSENASARAEEEEEEKKMMMKKRPLPSSVFGSDPSHGHSLVIDAHHSRSNVVEGPIDGDGNASGDGDGYGSDGGDGYGSDDGYGHYFDDGDGYAVDGGDGLGIDDGYGQHTDDRDGYGTDDGDGLATDDDEGCGTDDGDGYGIDDRSACAKRRKTEQSMEGAKSFADDDKRIEGKWRIHCRYIEEQWEQARDLWMCVARKKSGGLIGKFNFGVISGVIKFKKASGEKGENDEKLEFRWRGIDCGTGEVLYLDEDQRGWASSIGGGKFKGKFEFMGMHNMSGFKLREASLSEINEGWEDYGYEAHERARIGRW